MSILLKVKTKMRSKLFRLTGLLYLLVIICAGTSQGYIRGSLIITDDINTTVRNITENAGLFRLGITLDLVAFILDVVISVLLYQLFKDFGRTLAMVTAAFRLVAHPAIGSLNLLNHYLGYRLISNTDSLNAFDQAQLDALGMFFLEGHSYGYLLAGGFFGVHCLLLGILIYKSNTVPNFIGGFIVGSGIGYLIETFGNFNVPGYEQYTALIVGVAAALGELSLTLYFLLARKKRLNISL